MTEEYQTIVKRIIIRMVDAMDLWRPEQKEGEEAPAKKVIPTWEEKEMAVVRHMASYKGIISLLAVVDESLRKNPDVKQFQFVTRSFIQSAVGLVLDYAAERFPTEKEEFIKEQEEIRAHQAEFPESDSKSSDGDEDK